MPHRRLKRTVKTKLSDAIKQEFASEVHRRTALRYFKKHYECEFDGIWWIHLDRPKQQTITTGNELADSILSEEFKIAANS